MEKLIETIVNAIQDKKGKDIVTMDLSGFDGAICSHFVACNADSTAQVAAIAEEQGCSENTVKSRLNYGRKKVEQKVVPFYLVEVWEFMIQQKF